MIILNSSKFGDAEGCARSYPLGRNVHIMVPITGYINYLLRARSLAQILTGSIVYYGGVAIYDSSSGGRFAATPALVLTVLVPMGFCLLVNAENRD
jgi:hypothetical protein